MRILIIAFHSRSMTPYCAQYEDTLWANHIPYDIVFWDRFSDAPFEHRGKEYIFHRQCSLGGRKSKKIIPMLAFRQEVKSLIYENHYDKVIVLNTLPGVLLADVLLHRYKGKYIFDIRDYSYEKYLLYKYIVDTLINKSFCTTFSSAGFFKFLSYNSKVMINHNISNVEYKENKPSLSKNKGTVILGFIGALRYNMLNIALVNQLRGTKYNLLYAGLRNDGWTVDTYCEEHGVLNVEFEGEFDNHEKYKIYKKIDIINALYGGKTMEVVSALPNKLYDAALFKKPIMVSAGTYLAEIVTKYKLGFVIEDVSMVKEKLDSYVATFDANDFSDNAEWFLMQVHADQEKVKNKIADFVTFSEREE